MSREASKLFTEILDRHLERLRANGKKAKEIAGEAGIHEATLSLIRRGDRHPSKAMVVKLAGALEVEPNELLNAAGYALQDVKGHQRPVVDHHFDKEGLLEVERSIQKDKHVWVFYRTILENFDDDFYTTVLENHVKGVWYTYFFHVDNALQLWVLVKNLTRGGFDYQGEYPRGILLPDAYFWNENRDFFQCLYNAQSKEMRGFRTRFDVEDKYRYVEMERREGQQIEEGLKHLMDQAKGKSIKKGEDIISPVMAKEYLKVNHSFEDLDTLREAP